MSAQYPVRELMSTSLITVHPDTILGDIKGIFKSHKFHHLPVVSQYGDLVGIISSHDIQNAFELMFYQVEGGNWTKEELHQMKAEDIMTPNPICLDPEDDINKATDLFLYNKFHALPIVKTGQLIGIITVHDLLAHYFEYPEEKKI